MGLRALQAHQMGLNVTGHNIANANTEGYSRQRVNLVPSNPYMVPAFNKPRRRGRSVLVCRWLRLCGCGMTLSKCSSA